jgi:hypothetical protein
VHVAPTCVESGSRFLRRRLGDKGAGDLGVLDALLIPALFFFPFLLSFSMHFPVILRDLASPYMSPRWLVGGGVSPCLITLKTMVRVKGLCIVHKFMIT